MQEGAHRGADARKEVPPDGVGATVGGGASGLGAARGAVADALEEEAPHRRDAAEVKAL